ncbi:proline dehydrogenase [soil metagenome]
MSAGLNFNMLFRKGILLAVGNPAVEAFVDRYGMQLGAARFVAGENIDEAVVNLKQLEDEGFKTNTTLLGEGIADEAEALAVVGEYIYILDRLKVAGLNTNLSVKLTHLGLDLGEDVAYRNLERIVEHAAAVGTFVRIDMEESARVDATILIYRNLRTSGHDNVGTVLQSYLYRTERDLKMLMEYQPNLRIVKGAYLEPPEIAYPDKREVDVAYLRAVKYSLAHGGYTAVATHDDRIIDYVIEFTTRNDISQDTFEFQMLYGIRTELQRDLLNRGYKVLVATPFGPDWYPYLMRRMAERPANLIFVARQMLPGA